MPHKTEIARKEYFRQWRLANGPAVQRRKEKLAAERATPEGRAKRKEQAKRYYELHKDKIRSRHQKPRPKRPRTEKERNQWHIATYGISLAERQNMLEAQGNKCGCCGSPDPKWVKGWHLDHCHITKKIRSLLCKRCNTTLGTVGDNIELLQKMVSYLEAHR